MSKPRSSKSGSKAKRSKRPSSASAFLPNRDKNKYGLRRADLTDPIKRQIRQECHFGCVICGRLPYQYEHFDPPFASARKHEPSGMALLCPACHAETTAGRLSKEKIAQARAKPRNASRDPVWSSALGGHSAITLIVGGNKVTASDYAEVLRINNHTLLSLRRDGDDILFSGMLCNAEGKQTLHFQDNEVIVARGVWDLTFEGRTLTIRAGDRDVVASLTFDADQGTVSLERLKMRLGGGHHLEVTADSAKIKGRFNLGLGGNQVTGFGAPQAAIVIDIPELGTWKDWTSGK
jgi:hypothetical protein